MPARKIRVRFFFFTVDGKANTGAGWQIDQISLTQSSLQSTCADSNDSLATATPISLNQSLSGLKICPTGDVDYFTFNGSKGDQVGIWVDAKRIGSSLDRSGAAGRHGSLIAKTTTR